ncbi:Homeodomain-like superfamily protein [Prunus dulcis]|uniref:Homeodomain-like superfamily protein n=1 Tax=Prunus dulcis TaxID=3755 RepID=A0A4Y1R7U2_PRUDU|nr:Homeodomain-like superfamily protein [Prunus dulcis]
MFNLVGERWSLIAGRIPGRSAEEIEKYWTSRYSTRPFDIKGSTLDQRLVCAKAILHHMSFVMS